MGVDHPASTRHHLMQGTWVQEPAAARDLADAAIIARDRSTLAGEVWRLFVEQRRREEETSARAYLVVERGEAMVREPAHAQIYATVRTLVKAVEARDFYLRGHGDRVAHLAAAIAEEMGLSRDLVEGVRVAGRLHDLGLLAAGDLVLLKPEPLTATERRLVETHPVVSAQILEALDFPWEVKPAVRHHHERYDGSGYPDGLVGEEIPLSARILGVAEVYAAMTEDRIYRAARTAAEALEHLLSDGGQRYDPVVVTAVERVLAGEHGTDTAARETPEMDDRLSDT